MDQNYSAEIYHYMHACELRLCMTSVVILEHLSFDDLSIGRTYGLRRSGISCIK